MKIEPPKPDTHCWDEDEQKDVWSYSLELLIQYGEDCAKSAREACAIPPGWKLAPIVPTQAMLDANGKSTLPEVKEWLEKDARETWAAMIAEVPEPPTDNGG